jgi:hypothetical protein
MGVNPIIWIVWAAVATILAALLIYRGTLLQNEDDQIYLDANAEHQQHEQELILNRAKKLTPYVYVASAATVLMGLGILIFIVMQALRSLS